MDKHQKGQKTVNPTYNVVLKQILTDTRALIDTRDKWTQHAWARDNDGSPIDFTNPDAVCYCLHGAVNKVQSSWPHPVVIDGNMQKSPGWVFGDVSDLLVANNLTPRDQDNMTHGEVMAKLDGIIASLT
jgi:hypothetical protein